jgi:hypothetical protein
LECLSLTEGELTVTLAASSGLNFLIADSLNCNRKAEILETECFMLSFILFALRIKSEGYLKNDSDYNIAEKIFGNLYDDYITVRKIGHLAVMEKRTDVYENLYFKKGPLEIAQMFFTIFFHEMKTMQIYAGNGVFFMKPKMDIQSFGVLTKLFKNVFMAVELFFKDGVAAYLEKEIHPSDDFKKKAQKYYNKYIE